MPILYEGEPAGLLRGEVAIDAPFLRRLRATRGIDLVLVDDHDRPLASTLADSTLAPVLAAGGPPRLRLGGGSYIADGFPLVLGSGVHARITGLVSTAAADRAVRELQLAAALLAVLGIALAALLGAVWSSQVSRPVERLAAFSQRLAQGDWDELLTLRSVGELQTLVHALERMRSDLRRYREQLIIGERHAAWSLMARKVAHEIKNPLTPIVISISDLKRSYELGRPDFPSILDHAVRTVSEEVQTLKHLLEEFSALGRFPAPVFEPCDAGALLADLEALYAREVAEGRFQVRQPAAPVVVTADAAQLRQALVNLVKNGLEAIDGNGCVTLVAAAAGEGLEIAVTDTGPGLTPEQRAQLFVPGFTTKAAGSGLGLTIVERIVHDHRGTIAVEPGTRGGTVFRVVLPRDPRS